MKHGITHKLKVTVVRFVGKFFSQVTSHEAQDNTQVKSYSCEICRKIFQSSHIS